METERDHLDALLDSAIKDYVDRDPPLGLERRILLKAAQAPKRPWMMLAGIPVAAALGVACLLMLIAPPGDLPAPPPPAVPNVRASIVDTVPVTRARVVAARPRTSSIPDSGAARRRALIQFIETNPGVAGELLSNLHEEMKPIAIEALDIRPLRIDELKIEEQTNEGSDDLPGSADAGQPRIFADR